MIPSPAAATIEKALDALATRNPPKKVGEAAMRIRQVVQTHVGDDDAFNPVDFTESDLSEATKVFELAARKEISGFDDATKDAHSAFRSGMNEAQDPKARTKCRTALIVDLIVAVAKKL